MRAWQHRPTREALRRATISSLLALAITSASAAANAAPPALTFSDSEVTITAAQAGKIVYFGVAREFYDAGVTVTPYSGIGEAKAGETVVVTPRLGVSPSALWAAIDLATGEVALSYPDGSPVEVTTIEGDPKAGLRKIDLMTDSAYVLLLRPGLGAWISRVGDGGPSDQDGLIDGKLGAATERMVPLAGSPAAPETIVANDVVLGINPSTFSVFVAEVTE